jgi:hypothetical protein
VSREVLDPTPALGPQAVALLSLARMLPEQSVLALRAAAASPSTRVRRALLHFTGSACACATEALVGEAQLCARGRRLVDAARGWRARPAA